MTDWQMEALMLPEQNVIADLGFILGSAIILCAIAIIAWRVVYDD